MSIVEAVRGAQADLATITGPREKLTRLLQYGRIFASELTGQVFVAPFGLRAYRQYKGMQRVKFDGTPPSQPGVISMVEDLRYGSQPRTGVDVYLPAASSPDISGRTVSSTASSGGMPVALFCHGGIWAHGERWHYAPLASRLAQAGVLTIVMSYSLYPEVLAPQQVIEVGQALSWTLDNAAKLGGDPGEISLIGHSAGAHICQMALLSRAKAKAASAKARRQTSPSGESTDASPDVRMPKRFVGMAGVYDIAKHFEYESLRGVEEMSTMKRAVGGTSYFASQSPAVLVARALRGSLDAKGGAASQYTSKRRGPQLHGEAVSHRIGFERPAGNMAAVLAAVVEPESEERAVEQYTVDEIKMLPPTIMTSSCTDLIVPWFESASMFWMLHDCGVPSKHLVYNKVGHGDFVTGWSPSKDCEGVDDGHELAEPCRDLLLILSKQADVDYI